MDCWIVDDTGSKTTNCQVGVSLSVAMRGEQLAIDLELYLPKSWTIQRRGKKRPSPRDSLSNQTGIGPADD